MLRNTIRSLMLCLLRFVPMTAAPVVDVFIRRFLTSTIMTSFVAGRGVFELLLCLLRFVPLTATPVVVVVLRRCLPSIIMTSFVAGRGVFAAGGLGFLASLAGTGGHGDCKNTIILGSVGCA